MLVGKAVPYGAIVFAQQLAIMGFGVGLLGLAVRRWDLLVMVGITWIMTLLSAGAALATLVRSHSELSALVDIGGLFLTVLGGAMVPLTLMPEWLRAIAPASRGPDRPARRDQRRYARRRAQRRCPAGRGVGAGSGRGVAHRPWLGS